MKSLRFILVSVSALFLFTIPLVLKAQTGWAPLGAKWYYGYTNPFDGEHGYIKMESMKDTTISGTQCMKIASNSYYRKFYQSQVYIKRGEYYMFSKNGKVYYYGMDKFRLLYDFSLVAGDTLRIQQNATYNDTVITSYLIDSIGYKNLNGKNLKIQYFHPLDTFYQFGYSVKFFNNAFNRNGFFIENIGYSGWLFGFESVDIDQFRASLRCYSDSNVSFNLTPKINCDSIDAPLFGIPEINSNQPYIQMPVGNELYLNCKRPNPYNILIANSLGKVMDAFNNNKTEKTHFNIGSYPAGIYFLIISDEKERLNLKFIKN